MTQAQEYFRQGNDYQVAGEVGKAKKSFRAALSIDPTHLNAMNYLGVMEASQGHHSIAVKRFAWAVLIREDFAPFQLNLGNSLFGLEQYAEAERAYKNCLELDRGCLIAYYRRGLSRHFQSKDELAVKDILDAIAIDPRSDDFYLHAGIFSQSGGEMYAAEVFYRRSGIVNPKNSKARNNYGSILKNSNRAKDSHFQYISALCSDPGFYDAWYNLAIYYDELPNAPASIDYLERALYIDKSDTKAQYNYSLYLLKSGNFEAGWRCFEVRWRAKAFQSKPYQSIRPNWVPGGQKQRILVWGEQGIGDVILFSSMLAELRPITAVLIVAVTDKLVPLFQRSFPFARIVSYNSIPSYADYDFHISMGALGQYFRLSKHDFPMDRGPYLIPDQEKANLFRSSLSSKEIICGISWRSLRAEIGSEKSIDLEDLLPVLSIEGVTFINLQYGDVDEEISLFNDKFGTDIKKFSEVDKYNDIDSFTALVEMCDLIVTVSNTTAHIAGGLSKKTALLTPAGKGKLWYWGNEDGRYSLWYPSISLYHQGSSANGWSQAIQEIRRFVLDLLQR